MFQVTLAIPAGARTLYVETCQDADGLDPFGTGCAEVVLAAGERRTVRIEIVAATPGDADADADVPDDADADVPVDADGAPDAPDAEDFGPGSSTSSRTVRTPWTRDSRTTRPRRTSAARGSTSMSPRRSTPTSLPRMPRRHRRAGRGGRGRGRGVRDDGHPGRDRRRGRRARPADPRDQRDRLRQRRHRSHRVRRALQLRRRRRAVRRPGAAVRQRRHRHRRRLRHPAADLHRDPGRQLPRRGLGRPAPHPARRLLVRTAARRRPGSGPERRLRLHRRGRCPGPVLERRQRRRRRRWRGLRRPRPRLGRGLPAPGDNNARLGALQRRPPAADSHDNGTDFFVLDPPLRRAAVGPAPAPRGAPLVAPGTEPRRVAQLLEQPALPLVELCRQHDPYLGQQVAALAVPQRQPLPAQPQPVAARTPRRQLHLHRPVRRRHPHRRAERRFPGGHRDRHHQLVALPPELAVRSQPDRQQQVARLRPAASGTRGRPAGSGRRRAPPPESGSRRSAARRRRW
ncbi:MAG: hypothetical protein MZV63_56520 [Marinilabiliales bacterium]|nr:hypothetical protein [Marinilabiliales bacterium]